ncbi:MAG: UDP-glucose/GDP-mannose dehydrogenase family protein [Chloroflexi bacterium]|nr:UDP-glucose/GDP-mannose dehydrogenase family protein [Chloroflexota bacterium]
MRRLNKGLPPLFEPDLQELISTNVAAGRLTYTTDLRRALTGAGYVIFALDTPVDEDDEVDLSEIEASAAAAAPLLPPSAQVIVSSQVPLGTCERIEGILRRLNPALEPPIACVPENLKLGDAVRRFLQPDMVIIGADDAPAQDRAERLFAPLGAPVVKMDLRSAEMAKHALNAYVATCISFINEIATLCEELGADADGVAAALRLDSRIGPEAPLRPGLGFAGGTLARELKTLRHLGERAGCRTDLVEGVLAANDARSHRVVEQLKKMYPSFKGVTVGFLGLTYKAGTSTLRRSPALAIIDDLLRDGARVKAYDPKAERGEIRRRGLNLCADPYAAASGSDVLVLATGWPEFEALDLASLRTAMRRPVIFDCQNLLDQARAVQAGFAYVGVGRSAGIEGPR